MSKPGSSRKAPKSKTPAKPSEQRKGSARNKKGKKKE
tara:strand:- start:136 stop:246 length:111 start_codon:yes stop_codon:yes gene_type:complete